MNVLMFRRFKLTLLASLMSVVAVTGQNAPTTYATFQVPRLNVGFLTGNLAGLAPEQSQGVFPMTGTSVQIGSNMFRVATYPGDLVSLQSQDGAYLSYNGVRIVTANTPANGGMFLVVYYNARQAAEILARQRAQRNNGARPQREADVE